MNKGFHINKEKYGKFIAVAFDILGRICSKFSQEKLLKLHDKVSTKYNDRRTKAFSHISAGYESRIFYLTEWAEELIDVPFEYLTVKIPKQFDGCLTT